MTMHSFAPQQWEGLAAKDALAVLGPLSVQASVELQLPKPLVFLSA